MPRHLCDCGEEFGEGEPCHTAVELDGTYVYARFPSMHALGYKDQLARIASIDHESGAVNLLRAEDDQPLFNGATYINSERRGPNDFYEFDPAAPRVRFGYFAISDKRFTPNVGGR